MRLLICLCLAASTAVLAGCNATPRIADSVLDSKSLRESQRAAVVFRVARPDPACLQFGVQLGVREGQLFRPGTLMKLTQPAVTQVIETVLPPGEYHVVGFTCFRARSTQVLSDPLGNGFMGRSFAAFNISAGEIVNLGELKLVDKRRIHGIWNSFHELEVEVVDWSPHELERYKIQHPKLYAEMRVRLMTPAKSGTPDQPQTGCDDLRKLQAAGKVQNMPAACATAAARKP